MRFAGDKLKLPAKMDKPMSKGGTKGSFRAAATKNDMTPTQFARHVLANKDRYSPAMRKRAGFVKAANTWRKG